MDLREHLIVNKNIALQAEASDWKGAVKLGADLLVRSGSAEPRYYDSIIANTEKLGPYYILGPGIAMPHARPEGGAIDNGFALVTLKKPVPFGDPDNDPIDVLITMVATSAEEQNKSAIVQIVSLLDSEDTVKKLRSARTIEDIKKIFDELPED